MDKKIKKTIEKITEKLFKLLEVEKPKIEVNQTKDDWKIKIDSQDNALLIGHHGERIMALELVIKLLIYKKLKEWKNLSLEIGDYRQQREESLKNTALSYAQKVIFSGKPIALRNLLSYERRIIHLVLADNPKVETESIGDDRERRLIIKPTV